MESHTSMNRYKTFILSFSGKMSLFSNELTLYNKIVYEQGVFITKLPHNLKHIVTLWGFTCGKTPTLMEKPINLSFQHLS